MRAPKIPYAVCGGIAVTAYGATRTTKDIDIAIAREHVAPALAAVAPLGYTIPAGTQHLVLELLVAEAAYLHTK